MRNRIKQIIIDEFSRLTNLIEADFISNYKNKVNNFLLSQMDERITASMVFVSSFESKSGFAIETCAKRIAQLKFGVENVPTVVNPRNLKHNVDTTTISGQVILTDVDIFNANLRGEIAQYRAKNEANGKGKRRIESGVTLDSLKTNLLPLSKKYQTNKFFTKPVDLAFFDGNQWNILELKAGGDLDSSNAPSNVEKLLTIYVGMGIDNCCAYFATLYNKNGEGNTWTGAVKKHLNYPTMFLIGASFWNKILPEGIDFDEFTRTYKEALDEIDLNKHINDMISDCIGE